MKKRWIYLMLLAGFVAGAVLLMPAADVYRYSQRDETRIADAAIVLGAAVYRERPSPVFRERINHAIRLYQAGQVEMIIFTGGVGYGDTLSEAEVGRQYAIARGVPATAILMETTSTSTYENLANAKAVASLNGLDTFLIVSTPYHMRRAMALADELEMDAYSSPTRSIQWISRLTQSMAYGREVIAYMAYLAGDR